MAFFCYDFIANYMKKVVFIGGGVGSSTFTRAAKQLPVELTTIVSTFDDGGSTGAIRRDYRGIALGDFRQCIIASLDLDPKLIEVLNYRFGNGNLFGINIGNILIRAFLDSHQNQRQAVNRLHKILALSNKVVPVSYDFAKLKAKLSDGRVLPDQAAIATHFDFLKPTIKSLYLEKNAKISAEAAKAIKAADYLIFAPGHFFTSLLPHLYVDGFASAWKKSKAKKVWFVNLLAHRGQDHFYSLSDYLGWFQKKLGIKPFDTIYVNSQISQRLLNKVKQRFSQLKVTKKDLNLLRQLRIEFKTVDLVSSKLRKQPTNDTVPRAPMRHDTDKISKHLKKLIDAG